MFNYIISFLTFDIGNHDILDEDLEEYKMLTDFEYTEIIRYHDLFLKLTDKNEYMTKDIFQNIEGRLYEVYSFILCLMYQYLYPKLICNH